LGEICRNVHLETDPNTAEDKLIAWIESDIVDLFKNVEGEICKVQTKVSSRKNIMVLMD